MKLRPYKKGEYQLILSITFENKLSKNIYKLIWNFLSKKYEFQNFDLVPLWFVSKSIGFNPTLKAPCTKDVN